MLEMTDIVADSDMVAPQPFTILRSAGQFVAGSFQSSTTPIQAIGPVQRASSKEITMLQEADLVGAVMAFWWTQRIYVTRGKAPLPSLQGVTPAGAIPGSVYTLSPAPPAGANGELTKNGLLLLPGINYQLSADGTTVTLTNSTVLDDVLYFRWPTVSLTGPAASDILVYEEAQYRVLQVKHYPGSGYWKALSTRLSAA